ncbi:hypothetical protein DX912_07265 [Lysobacter soli]|uniref:Restriction endonuclease n=1 Tax=Lysobacter soli TaxID=453783 RepID=A0A3D8VEI9_9GAMM|nr:hypothetical protein [Lysobacter soli]RDY67715.1 hypothetical protein DX912_07265 [Lysobacter soli]
MADSPSEPARSINPRAVRYVKLGPGGSWEQDSKRLGILRFGFESADPETLALCRAKDWDELARSWREQGKQSPGTATSFTNQIRAFFEDQGDTLWVTFIDDVLHYGFLEPGEPQRWDRDANYSSYRTLCGGWRTTDATGATLTKTSLPGTITKLSMFRGTSCNVIDAERLVKRINGQRSDEVTRVEQARTSLLEALVPLIQMLHERDFEILIDMGFVNAGWRRLGAVGGNQATKDLDLEAPLTRERAYVQIKCQTTQGELDAYAKDFANKDTYDRLFYVYHTGQIEHSFSEAGVTLFGAGDVARMVLEGGLVDWVIDRVK